MLNGLLRRYPVPVVYLAVLGVVSAVYAHALSVSDQRFLVGWASTNIANLSTRPITTLVASAFLSEDSVLVWAVITSTALVLLVHVFGNVRAAVLVAAGHVVGTLVSEGIAAWRLWLGAVPAAITHIADVGPSYVTMAALAAVMAYGPGRLPRILATAGWLVLAPFLFDGIEDLDVAAVGHLVSMLVGALVPVVFRWRPRPCLLDHALVFCRWSMWCSRVLSVSWWMLCVMDQTGNVTEGAGVPTQAYRKDQLSNGYRELRARGHADSSRTAEARQHRARLVAEQIVATHGAWLTVEDCDIRTWFKLWGKACSAFAPGMLITALDHECRAAGGRLTRASTTRTAMSQHCLCGARVRKSLRDRTHTCPECGLVGDRDLVSSALGAFVTFTDPEDPSTARVDYERARHALRVFDQGLLGALSESTASCPAPSGRDHAAATRHQARSWRRVASAPRSAGKCTVPTPAETPYGDHAGQTPRQPGLSTRSTGQALRPLPCRI